MSKKIVQLIGKIVQMSTQNNSPNKQKIVQMAKKMFLNESKR